ncbi:unnamed protein product [Moneuplotes crassus]|uniref:Uncharacterized protein n=1 Tax=Euplotes crassus TaxID=5936 RepID=A0AAD1USH7_EUPCR|nr:unnamed protein product [Moneuplotes crassus]
MDPEEAINIANDDNYDHPDNEIAYEEYPQIEENPKTPEKEVRIYQEHNDFIKEFSSQEIENTIEINNEINGDHSLESIQEDIAHNDTDSIQDEVIGYLQNLNEKSTFSKFEKTQKKIRDISSRFRGILNKNSAENQPITLNSLYSAQKYTESVRKEQGSCYNKNIERIRNLRNSTKKKLTLCGSFSTYKNKISERKKSENSSFKKQMLIKQMNEAFKSTRKYSQSNYNPDFHRPCKPSLKEYCRPGINKDAFTSSKRSNSELQYSKIWKSHTQTNFGKFQNPSNIERRVETKPQRSNLLIKNRFSNYLSTKRPERFIQPCPITSSSIERRNTCEEVGKRLFTIEERADICCTPELKQLSTGYTKNPILAKGSKSRLKHKSPLQRNNNWF